MSADNRNEPRDHHEAVLLGEDLAAQVADVIAHTEIVHVGEVDVVTSPESAFVVGKSFSEGWSAQYVVDVSEDRFWELVEMFFGPEEVVEMKLHLDDMLRMESEGGPCLS